MGRRYEEEEERDELDGTERKSRPCDCDAAARLSQSFCCSKGGWSTTMEYISVLQSLIISATPLVNEF